MSYSYKPVLLKAIYEYMDSSGRVALPDVVDYFIDFYEDRKAHGMIAEKSTSIYQKGGYTRKDVAIPGKMWRRTSSPIPSSALRICDS